MKSLLTLLAFIFISFTASAQVQKFTIDGKTYYGTKKIPDEIKGKYLYESKKAPIVNVQTGEMAGQFQPHDVPEYPASFWVQTDEKGNVQMVKSDVNKNYQVVLILEYGDNGHSGWKGDKKETFDRIEATVDYTRNVVVILGERFKPIGGSY